MGRPARIVLFVGLGLVALLGWRARVLDGLGAGFPGGTPRPFGRPAHGVLEGRVALDEALAALVARADVDDLEVRALTPFGVARAGVEDNGRFVLDGLPLAPVDLEVHLGGERLARLTGVAPERVFAPDGDVSVAPHDPRLDGIPLAGPLRVIEIAVDSAEGGPIGQGWLAWRRAGEGPFEAVVPVVDGGATIVSLAELVDVLPILPGYSAPRLPCAFGGERLVALPGARLRAPAPELPEGIVARLEAEHVAVPDELAGEAALRAAEVRGGWPEGGAAELWLSNPGRVRVRWVTYGLLGERVSRLKGFVSPTAEVDVAASSTKAVDVPFSREALEAAAATFVAEEGRRPR